MLHPGFEPGLPRPQRGVLTTRLIELVKIGDAGFRSRCLALAKRALFQLSYTPKLSCWFNIFVCDAWPSLTFIYIHALIIFDT